MRCQRTPLHYCDSATTFTVRTNSFREHHCGIPRKDGITEFTGAAWRGSHAILPRIHIAEKLRANLVQHWLYARVQRNLASGCTRRCPYLHSPDEHENLDACASVQHQFRHWNLLSDGCAMQITALWRGKGLKLSKFLTSRFLLYTRIRWRTQEELCNSKSHKGIDLFFSSYFLNDKPYFMREQLESLVKTRPLWIHGVVSYRSFGRG